jgi:hypothetical protein
MELTPVTPEQFLKESLSLLAKLEAESISLVVFLGLTTRLMQRLSINDPEGASRAASKYLGTFPGFTELAELPKGDLSGEEKEALAFLSQMQSLVLI